MEIKKIVKLTNDQYSELLINGQVVVDGVIKYWEDGTLYVSDSALETVELRNMIDKGLVKPNKLTHEQYIYPKVKDLIESVEYPEGYLEIPDYEWNYIIIKGSMVNGDYFKHQPGSLDNFGKVYIWNEAEWQEVLNDYTCTSDDEEEVMLKIYAPTFGYDKEIKVTRDCFKFEIKDLGVHTTKDLIDGSIYYSDKIDFYDLCYISKNLYVYGNINLIDTNFVNSVIKIEVDGNLNQLTIYKGFIGIEYLKANKIIRINSLHCPVLKEIDVNDLTEINRATYSGFYETVLYNLEKIPKALYYGSSAFRYAGQNVSNFKDLRLILDYPCTINAQAFTYNQSKYIYVGEDVIFNGDLIFAYSGKMEKVDIHCPTLATNAFYQNSTLTDVFISNKCTSIQSNSFGGCTNLMNVVLEDGFDGSVLNLSVSTKYPEDVMLAWIVALKDNTGTTAKTFTIGTTNKNKFFTKKISYADDLGKWEFDDGYNLITEIEINKPYRITGRPATLDRVFERTYIHDYIEGTDYTYSDGYITFINPEKAGENVGINYTTTATMTCQLMASQKNWNVN